MREWGMYDVLRFDAVRAREDILLVAIVKLFVQYN